MTSASWKILGLLFLIIIPIYLISILPNLNLLSSNQLVTTNLNHTENNRFEIGGKWSGDVPSASSIENIIVSITPNELATETKFTVKSLQGQVLFSFSQHFIVDRHTRHNLPDGTDKKGETYYTFPLNVQKQSYLWWAHTFSRPVTLEYANEQTVNGVNTYHFVARKIAVDDTEGYSFLDLVPEKYNVRTIADIDIYVEPVSGIIIDYQDKGVSSYLDRQGTVIQDIAQWSNHFSEITIQRMATMAEGLKIKVLFTRSYFPAILILIGIALSLHINLFPKRSKSR